LILVDTSVWIDFVMGDPATARLGAMLEATLVTLHPAVHGELALGQRNPSRVRLLELLPALAQARAATDAQVLQLVTERNLFGSGIGWVDAHLLASVLLTRDKLWTRDRRLAAAARALGIAFDAVGH